MSEGHLKSSKDTHKGLQSQMLRVMESLLREVVRSNPTENFFYRKKKL